MGTEPVLATRSLARYTTLRVGGEARRLVTVETEAELIGYVEEADGADDPVLLLGGGSNVLISDDGFPGTVVRVATTGVSAEVSGCTGAVVTIAAGEDWDRLVARAVAEEWGGGIECLSGIPGLVGASPLQNIGAYGAELSDIVETVRTWDRRTRTRATFPAGECGFRYRTSRFKAEPNRYAILSVTLQLPLASLSAPIRYPELARALDVSLGERVPASEVREAVLALRRSKGMVLEPADHDTWSAGSFFTNPILSAAVAARLPVDAPRFAQSDGTVKTSAAWLIEQAGFDRGFGTPPATLSTKHSLALTNRGGASAAQLIELARVIRSGVAERFGITLAPEPILVGAQL